MVSNIKELYEQGYSDRQISSKLSINRYHIIKWRNDNNLKPNKNINYPSKINKQISKENLAYIAGFIDGEGSLGLYKNGTVKIFIYNTNKEVLDWITSKLNTGKVFINRESIGNHKTSYVLAIQKHSDVYNLLIMILPYLIIKNKQAKLLIESLTTKAENKTWNIPYTLDDSYIDKMKLINKRGL